MKGKKKRNAERRPQKVIRENTYVGKREIIWSSKDLKGEGEVYEGIKRGHMILKEEFIWR